jgi:predicted dehydrogenase
LRQPIIRSAALQRGAPDWPKDAARFAEVPESVSFVLEYPSSVLAACECSFGTAVGRRYRINGDKGFIEMDPASAYNGLELSIKRGDEAKGTAEVAKLAIEQKYHFTEEMDAFSRAVTEGEKVRTPGAMGLADVKVVAAVMEAARTGGKAEIR